MPRTAFTPQPEPRLSGENRDVAQKRSDGGFSLIFMSILVTVGAMIMVSFLPGKEAGDYNAKAIDDIDKLNTVEEHMRSFMAANRRRPCPADGQYSINSPNFGREAAIAGTCQGGTPSAPLGPDTSTTNCGGGGCIVAGVIPTRSLGLDASYAFDSYGRRFTYVVDKRATTTAACIDLEGIELGSTTPTGKGGLYIDDIAGKQIDQVMYAYIQHGPSGYGAFPAQGSTAANRINSGSTDLAMQVDAGVAPGANPGNSTFSPDLINTLVKNSMTVPTTSGGLDTGFNDLVWYRDDIKNTCCLGKACIPLGFRVDGNATAGQEMNIIGTGDINGDGYQDLVLESRTSGYPSYTKDIYVIFGTSNMSSDSNTPWPIPPTGLDPSTLNGTNGFVIPYYIYAGSAIAIADVNGDGYADIVIGGSTYCCPNTTPNAYIIFGGPGGAATGTSWLPAGSTLTLANLNGYRGPLDGVHTGNSGNGTSGVIINIPPTSTAKGIFPSSGGYIATGVEVGKIEDYSETNAYSDIIVTAGSSNGFVIYGKPSVGAGPNGVNDNWASTPTINANTIDGTQGFQFHDSFVDGNVYSQGYTMMNEGGVTGDFDNDGFDDFMLTDTHICETIGGSSICGVADLIYGRSRANWTSAFTTYNSNSAVVNLRAELSATPNRGTEFYTSGNWFFGWRPFVADLNGDGHKDFMITSYRSAPLVAVYGNSCTSVAKGCSISGSSYRWPATYNVYHIASGEGFYANSNTGKPSWLSAPYYFTNPLTASAADLNGDGKLDLILNYAEDAAPQSRSSAGAMFVIYQPSGGWPNTINYNDYKWDGTDSFQIYGPKANAYCGGSGAGAGNSISYSTRAGDVRVGDGSKPEILISCPYNGENSYGSIYGLYKNKGWPSSIDLNQLN